MAARSKYSQHRNDAGEFFGEHLRFRRKQRRFPCDACLWRGRQRQHARRVCSPLGVPFDHRLNAYPTPFQYRRHPPTHNRLTQRDRSVDVRELSTGRIPRSFNGREHSFSPLDKSRSSVRRPFQTLRRSFGQTEYSRRLARRSLQKIHRSFCKKERSFCRIGLNISRLR